jgi:mannose-6-phosphate isomerase
MNAPDPALLLKLLFTKEPLSIQVHPNDAFAQSIGLGHGKTEAWYILSATPGAKIAVGLKRQLTTPQLRASIEDGSISDLVQWHRVLKDDVIFVPAARSMPSARGSWLQRSSREATRRSAFSTMVGSGNFT